MGGLRYGWLGEEDKPQYNRIKDAIRRLEAYKKDANAEHLVDVANLMEIEFVEGRHKGVDPADDGEHTRRL